MKALIVDANVLVAYFVKHDPHHLKALPLFDEKGSPKMVFHTPMIIFLEACSVIKNETKDVYRAEWFRSQFFFWHREGKIRLYELNRRRMETALKILLKHDYKLHASDAVALALCEELRLPIKSFDGDVERVAELL